MLNIKILNGHKCRPSFNSSPNPVSSTLEHVPRLISRHGTRFLPLRCFARKNPFLSFPFWKMDVNEGGSMPLKIPSPPLPPPATWQEMSPPFIQRKYESLPDLFVTGQLGINCAPELNEFQPREFSIDLPSFSADSRCYLRHQFPRYLFIITFLTNFNVKTWSPMCVVIFQRRF